MGNVRVVFKWKYWVFFFSIGGKCGVIHFHSEGEELERESLCWGVQSGKGPEPFVGLGC